MTAEDVISKVDVPNIEGKSIYEASKILKENNLQLVINNDNEQLDKENTIIKQQSPKTGISVNEGSTVYIEY